MKLYAKILAAAAAFALSGAASAANSLSAGSMALNVSVFDGTSAAVQSSVVAGGADDLYIVQGKYFLQKDLAILGGAGIGIKGGDAKGTDFGIRAGARKYMKTTDFAPFFGGYFQYSSTNDSNYKIMQIMGEFGAEYFFSKQFSIEGAARAGYMSGEDSTGATTVKATNIGTASAGVSFNFYF
jgi:hypothetical protein